MAGEAAAGGAATGGNAGGVAGGAGAAAGGAAAGGAAGAAAGGAAEFSWASAGLDADSLNYVQSKGFKGIPDVVQSYRGAEKLLGVPAENVLKLPTGDNPDFGPIYDKLGRPKSAADYGLAKVQGADPKFAETMASAFHEAGLSSKQASALVAKYGEFGKAVGEAATAARTAEHAKQINALKAEWAGPDFDKNMAFVDRAAQVFGMDGKMVGALRDAWGPAAAAKFLHNLGTKLGTDDNFIAHDGRGNFTGGETAEQASAKKAELMKDKAWVAKWQSGDIEARREMQRLNRILSPGSLSF